MEQNQSDSLMMMQVELSPLSVRGSLAFWRQLAQGTSSTPNSIDQHHSTPNHLQAAPQNNANLPVPLAIFSSTNDLNEHQRRFIGNPSNQQRRRSNNANNSTTNTSNNNRLCQQQYLKTNYNNIRPTSTSTLINNNNNNNLKLANPLSQSQWQIVAVEGKSLQINLLLVLHSFNKHDSRQLMDNSHERLSISWLRNNRQFDVHTHRVSSNSNTRQQSESASSFNRRFSQQFISGPESLAFVDNNHESSNNNMNNNHQTDEWQQFQLFMLANHINEPLLNRLHKTVSIGSSFSANLNNIQDLASFKANILKSSDLSISNESDQFVGAANDPSAIDWARAYAHYKQQNSWLSNCNENQSDQQEQQQLALIRLSINQLEVDDSAIYQIRVCSIANSQPQVNNIQFTKQTSKISYGNNLCYSVQFNLQIAPDIPKFETWLEPEILDSGSRLSIKCQASGFTLPQISWFLDNQLISEHHHPQIQSNSNLNRISTSSISPSLVLSSRFRIGDYVSQDNQVHSFVNASHLLSTDGGVYKCRANNGLHQVESSARIDVRGLVSVPRPLQNITALVGTPELHFQCPYSGFPITMIEWYFKPSVLNEAQSIKFRARRLANQEKVRISSNLDNIDRYANANSDDNDADELEDHQNQHDFSVPFKMVVAVDPQQQDPDTDLQEDEWLSQAQALTTVDPSDYPPEPDSWPDYPPSGLIPASSSSGQLLNVASNELLPNDYAGDFADYGQQIQRRRRDISAQQGTSNQAFDNTLSQMVPSQEQWIQFPQSRRHHIHSNGTLVLQSVSRDDQGQYKCRVLGPSTSPLHNTDSSMQQQQQQPNQADFSSWSNAFQLTVQVPPVISPFSSSESLREGMRNFLTCSVIEGDGPIKLSWLKNNQPIEEYIDSLLTHNSNWPQATSGSLTIEENNFNGNNGDLNGHGNNNNNNNNRIRVETSNEFTSTLFFQHVDFRDNGNYTCM